MRKTAAPLFVFLISFFAPPALADIAAIHSDALPQETAVLAALDDAKQLEPDSHAWTNNWKYPIAKKDAAARLDKDLDILSLSLKNHPDNAELALLTGLVARYAYNLDVPGSHETAINALGQARELAQSDVRVPWFHATLLCQTNQSKAGAEEMLGIEGSHAWDQMPAAFWNDYLECATIANMPAHGLRAADHLEKLHAPATEVRTAVTEATRKRYDAFDPNKQYEPTEVWQGAKSGGDIEFTSTTCGVQFRARSDWHIERLEVTKGSCVGLFRTGPYKGTVSSRTPNVLLLIQRPKENETLQEFSTKFLKDGTFSSFTPTRCPSDPCIALKQEKVGMYQGDGDGHGRVVIFERDQPEFPGLIFEAPLPLAESGVKEGVHAYHPSQIQQRIPGKLYYLVLLDTAASIEEPAMRDFDFFLQNLVVE